MFTLSSQSSHPPPFPSIIHQKLRSNLRKELSSVPCHVIYTLNAANPSADESGYSPSANTFAEEFVKTQLAAFNIPARLKAPAIMTKNKPASAAKPFTSMSCAQFLSRYELVLKDILDTSSAGPSLVLPSEKLKVNLLPQEMLLTTFSFLHVSDLMTGLCIQYLSLVCLHHLFPHSNPSLPSVATINIGSTIPGSISVPAATGLESHRFHLQPISEALRNPSWTAE
mgnify:CR=1 FL=1